MILSSHSQRRMGRWKQKQMKGAEERQWVRLIPRRLILFEISLRKISSTVKIKEGYTLDFRPNRTAIFISAMPNRFVSTLDWPPSSADCAIFDLTIQIQARRTSNTSIRSKKTFAGSVLIGTIGNFTHQITSSSSTSSRFN